MKLQFSWNVSISFLCQPLSWPSHWPTHESIRWVIAYKYLSFKIFRCFVWLAKTESSGLFFITIRRWPRLRSFGVIHLRISDLRSLGRIMENQVNRWILSESGFVGSFNASWSEWSRITNPDPDHPIRTYPNLEEVSNIPYRFDYILPKQLRFQTNISSINQVSCYQPRPSALEKNIHSSICIILHIILSLFQQLLNIRTRKEIASQTSKQRKCCFLICLFFLLEYSIFRHTYTYYVFF